MANVEMVTAQLPSLFTNRADSIKLEIAIRYVGDIIFNASQDRGGDKAKWLARVLASPSSTPPNRSEEAKTRDAILGLFRDGYLDRYADYPALRDIACAAAESASDPAWTEVFRSDSAVA
ncbi:MAG: hypothetical protein JO356_16070 [Acidobacteria bacterium]|nr:hypothetical protein [Acidobacteriota bacterium]